MTASPLPDAYWLVEGQLLAGPYPTYDAEEARHKMEAFLAAGIRSFIDLTEEEDPLPPYEPVLQAVAQEMGVEVRYQRYAIRDMSVPTRELMTDILHAIRAEIAAGRPVYFHCWGGLGRTGTVAACWLMGRGHTCDEALEQLNALRAQLPGWWAESPQTEGQREFVRRWTAE
jgi:protein-tyrosine phosphatase